MHPVYLRVLTLRHSPGLLKQDSQILVKPLPSSHQSQSNPLRIAPGGIFIETNDYPEGVYLFLSNNKQHGAGIVKNIEIIEGHAKCGWLTSFYTYTATEIKLPPQNCTFLIDKRSANIVKRNFDFMVKLECQNDKTLFVDILKSGAIVFDKMQIKLPNNNTVIINSLLTQIDPNKYLQCAFFDPARPNFLEQVNKLQYDIQYIEKQTDPIIIKPSSLTETLQKIIETEITPFFKSGLPDDGILIEGSSGAGKTVFAKLLEEHLQSHFIATELIDCRILKKLPEQLIEYFDNAVQRSPSIIILDGLDFIAADLEDSVEVAAPEKLSHYRVSCFIIENMLNFKSTRQAKFIATCRSAPRLHPLLLQSGIFQTKYTIGALTRSDKNQIIRELFPNIESIEEIALNAKAFTLNDFQLLLQRVQTQHPNPNLQEILEVMQDFIPSAIDSNATDWIQWEDIGGLGDVKQQLLEALYLPTKFSLLYNDYPLKLRSGVLLYGPPGCGKTLLARALPSYCNLNIISVKGPELLNKYIGASEQSVREVFAKARRASPCVLFFDEFEAIAGKRGSERTGVGDRVVNQLLVELDGVESRGQVFVLAASSRPELIDAALLRPGRLDLHLYCRFPNQEDRREILQIYLRKSQFECDIEEAARVTQQFTPADLSNIVNEIKIQSSKDTEFRFTEQILLDSIISTRPSFNNRQIEDYKNKFEEFKYGKVVPGRKTLQM